MNAMRRSALVLLLALVSPYLSAEAVATQQSLSKSRQGLPARGSAEAFAQDLNAAAAGDDSDEAPDTDQASAENNKDGESNTNNDAENTEDGDPDNDNGEDDEENNAENNNDGDSERTQNNNAASSHSEAGEDNKNNNAENNDDGDSEHKKGANVISKDDDENGEANMKNNAENNDDVDSEHNEGANIISKDNHANGEANVESNAENNDHGDSKHKKDDKDNAKNNEDGKNNKDSDDDDDDDDDGDDDDDTDDDKVPATGPTKAQAVAVLHVPVAVKTLSLVATKETPSGLAKEEDALEKQMRRERSPHARELAELKREVQKAQKDLHANLQKQSTLKHRVEELSDKVRSNAEIDAKGLQVAKETQSAGLGNMMAGMWKDMRMFEVPSYAQYAKEELPHLKRDQPKLEAKVQAANLKLGKAQRKWGKQAIYVGGAPSPGGAPAPAALSKPHRSPAPANPGGEHEDEEEHEEENEEADRAHHEDKKEQEKQLSPQLMTAAMPTLIFWQMHRSERVYFLAGSFVYVIGGICLAFVYNRARTELEMFTPRMVTTLEKRNQKQFSFSIFGCFKTPYITVMGCCFPCLRWADTMDRGTKEQKPLLAYRKAFAAFFTLSVLHCYTYGISSVALVVLGVYYRQKLRENYNIESGTKGSIAMDIAAWVFCQPCAIIQEAREQSIPRSQNAV